MYKLSCDPVISAPLRTPIAKHKGSLASIRPDDLMALVIDAVMKKSNLDQNLLEEIIIGCANQAGEDNRNIARMAGLLSGVGVHVPAITLNRLCSSGLDAIIDAARRVMIKESCVVFAGGVESMSRAPFVIAKAQKAFESPLQVFDTSLGWRFFNDKLLPITPAEPNGMTVELLANDLKISKTEQDSYALLSHKKAFLASENGYFKDEIVPVLISEKNNDPRLFFNDEGIRANCSLQQLSSLPSVFIKNGSVTAGNSSSLNDGAAGMIVSSYEKAKELDLKPLARIIGFASFALSPRKMGIAPVGACLKLIKEKNMSIKDFDCIEINEAFAAQTIAVIKELNLDENKVNPYGGAIALGHPLGCSGARIVVTLLNYLRKNNKSLGLATLCVGVGQGVCMAVEML